MMATTPLSEDGDMLAAELAFGLLDEPERSAAEARLASDPPFADSHRRWQDRAVALLASRPEQPRPSVWAAIHARLPANDGRPARAWASLRFWRTTTGLTSAAAVVLAVMAADRRPAPAPAPVAAAPAAPAIVAILGGDGRSAVSVSFDRASGRLIVAPSRLAIGERSAQLWVIPADGTPRSLAVIRADAPAAPRAPAATSRLIAPGVTLAISVEPLGGSPTGLPTGPVILTGKAVTI